MAGICGLRGREADDLESKAKNILSLMRKRGSESQTFSQSIASDEKIVIGVCDSTGLQSFAQQAISLALYGVFFGDDTGHDKTGPAGLGRLIQTLGSLALLHLIREQLIAGRDIGGLK